MHLPSQHITHLCVCTLEATCSHQLKGSIRHSDTQVILSLPASHWLKTQKRQRRIMERMERRRYPTSVMQPLALTTTPRWVPRPWQLSHEPNCTVNINSTLWDLPSVWRVCLCAHKTVALMPPESNQYVSLHRMTQQCNSSNSMWNSVPQ